VTFVSPAITSGYCHFARSRPEMVFRNPEKVEQGWKQMREDRAAFVEFFGEDELVLPPAEAGERLNAYLPAPAGSGARPAACPAPTPYPVPARRDARKPVAAAAAP
jgi:hypothetical protein